MKWATRQRIKTLLIVLLSLVVLGAFVAWLNRKRGRGLLLTWSRSKTIKPVPLASTEVILSGSPTPYASPNTSPSPTPSSAAASSPAPLFSPVGLIIPVAGVRADQLIDTFSEARSEGRVHDAIDIPASRGTAVLAVANGKILKLFQSERGGTTIYQLSSDEKFIYYYAHLDGYAGGLSEGQTVTQGETIAYVGDTGNAGAGNYHLHFSIAITSNPKRYWEGVNINPYPLLRK
jgi:murein DD-endopeptidase MepM/ murein hydrolase activator NlpD